jgi:hypothetical protein
VVQALQSISDRKHVLPETNSKDILNQNHNCLGLTEEILCSDSYRDENRTSADEKGGE